MDTFIITGANSEPAQSICRRLCETGIRVYGIGNTFPENGFKHEEFFPIPCDITNAQELISAVEKIIKNEPTICGLILATQFLESEAFEALPPEEIILASSALITAPLLITRLVLPTLIAVRGSLIAISPNTITPRGHVLNNITENAMKTLTGTLFAELRDTGVRTCHILLQNNPGPQDPAAKYTKVPQSRIQADIVADTLEMVLNLRENNALTQIVLRPQATREQPHIPISSEPKIRTLQVVQLPPAKNFPPEEKSIYTEKYRRPDYAPKVAKDDEFDEDDGFADDYVDPELRYLLKDRGSNHPAKFSKKESYNKEKLPLPAESVPEINSDEKPLANGAAKQSFAPNMNAPQNASAASSYGNTSYLENGQRFDENGNPIRKKRKRHRKRNRNKNRENNRNGAIHIRPPEFSSREDINTQKEKAFPAHPKENVVEAPEKKNFIPETPLPKAPSKSENSEKKESQFIEKEARKEIPQSVIPNDKSAVVEKNINTETKAKTLSLPQKTEQNEAPQNSSSEKTKKVRRTQKNVDSPVKKQSKKKAKPVSKKENTPKLKKVSKAQASSSKNTASPETQADKSKAKASTKKVTGNKTSRTTKKVSSPAKSKEKPSQKPTAGDEV